MVVDSARRSMATAERLGAAEFFLNQVSDAVVIFENGCVRFANTIFFEQVCPRTSLFSSINSDGGAPKPLPFCRDESDSFRRALADCLETGKTIDKVFTVSTTRVSKPWRLSCVTFSPYGESIVSCVFGRRDRTSHTTKQDYIDWVEDELEGLVRARVATLEEQIAQRNVFLNSMSHEIRTPLHGIIGPLDLLKVSQVNAEQRDLIDIAQVCCEQLRNVITDVLEIGKLDAGKMTIESTLFSPAAVLEESLEIVSFIAAKSNIELIADNDGQLPEFILGDPVRLRQILVNLLGNAIKFSKSESDVLVTMRARDVDEHGGCELQFVVQDFGIGISDKALESLFQPFQQASHDTTRRFGGSGLGLSICKRLVELMGGRVWCTSQENVGSSFYFTIVAKRASLSPPRPPVRVPGERSVLVVAPKPRLGELLCRSLATMGWVPTVATSSADAVALIDGPAASEFDAAVIDGQLGAELVRSVQQVVPRSCCIVTGYARLAGFESQPFLQKPVRISKLRKALSARNLLHSSSSDSSELSTLDLSSSADAAALGPLAADQMPEPGSPAQPPSSGATSPTRHSPPTATAAKPANQPKHKPANQPKHKPANQPKHKPQRASVLSSTTGDAFSGPLLADRDVCSAEDIEIGPMQLQQLKETFVPSNLLRRRMDRREMSNTFPGRASRKPLAPPPPLLSRMSMRASSSRELTRPGALLLPTPLAETEVELELDGSSVAVGAATAASDAADLDDEPLAPPSPPPLPRILIAEDNPINVRVMRKLLESLGSFTIDVADNGKQAVEAATITDYSLILMDLMMPEMNGVEASQLIRKTCQYQPPIIGVTASAFEEDRRRCLAAGMSDILTKPAQRVEVDQTLRRWLSPSG
eukprot:TRINITY_DN1462_c0_g1_i4.p1 TRINITY_DN1462_c0_g1~~TRINITY_DN1462_c0_g1_i4.p1  ORF type:complete len:875 (-),score=294.37 TRINITY_DN1462_c0_g1_i4:917-3541(-)